MTIQEIGTAIEVTHPTMSRTAALTWRPLKQRLDDNLARSLAGHLR